MTPTTLTPTAVQRTNSNQVSRVKARDLRLGCAQRPLGKAAVMQPRLLRILARAWTLTAIIAIAPSLIALTAEPASAQQSCNQPLTGSGTCTYQGQSYNYSCAPGAGIITCNVSGPACTGALTYNIVTGKFGGKCASIASASSASNTVPSSVQVLATSVRTVSHVSLSAVQSQFQNIRDAIQSRLMNPASGRPLGYAEDVADQAAGEPLAYADPNSLRWPLLVKAPGQSQPVDYGLTVWAQSYIDYENRWGVVNGFNTDSHTLSRGVTGGIDKTFIVGQQAFVFGLLGGETDASTYNVDGSSAGITGPSAGVYAIYINGGFSADGTFKADVLNISQAGAGGLVTPLGVVNYTFGGDTNYKVNMKDWWFEPTIGVSDVISDWNSTAQAMGLSNGYDLRLQGGSRFGTSFAWGPASVDATLLALVYDDVIITGGTLAAASAGTLLVPSDVGYLVGQGIGKLNFDWSNAIKGLSTFVEAEIRGREGVIGIAGRLGARYTW
jgi:hypothetical protein